jgi:hypothetical protein
VTGVLIDFGDSTNETSAPGGLPNALVTFTHVYGAVGNYMSRATISDAAVGTRVVTQQIVVIPRDTTGAVDQRTRRP